MIHYFNYLCKLQTSRDYIFVNIEVVIS